MLVFLREHTYVLRVAIMYIKKQRTLTILSHFICFRKYGHKSNLWIFRLSEYAITRDRES